MRNSIVIFPADADRDIITAYRVFHLLAKEVRLISLGQHCIRVSSIEKELRKAAVSPVADNTTLIQEGHPQLREWVHRFGESKFKLYDLQEFATASQEGSTKYDCIFIGSFYVSGVLSPLPPKDVLSVGQVILRKIERGHSFCFFSDASPERMAAWWPQSWLALIKPYIEYYPVNSIVADVPTDMASDDA